MVEVHAEGPSGRAWVIAALRALSSGGIDAVKVERLATHIGVSKAPFYWRFKDRKALLDAMLRYWNDDLTNDLIAKAALLPVPRRRLEALLELSLEEHTDGLSVSHVEAAIRAWAAQDAEVAAFVEAVDRVRVTYVAGELRALGAGEQEAEALANGIYVALIGLYTVRRYTPSSAADDGYVAIVRAVLDRLASGQPR